MALLQNHGCNKKSVKYIWLLQTCHWFSVLIVMSHEIRIIIHTIIQQFQVLINLSFVRKLRKSSSSSITVLASSLLIQILCLSKYSEMSKLKNPSRLSRRLGCLDNPSDLKTSHCTQWGINEHGSIYCHPNVASFMILHPLTADAVLKCQVITQHSPTCWSTGQFHPIPFSLPYCINCPLHLHFHPSLTGHMSVLDVSFFIIFAINVQASIGPSDCRQS